MQVEYLDADLLKAATQTQRPRGWTVTEVVRLQRLVQCLLAATLPSEVLNLRSLGLRLRHGTPDLAEATLSEVRPVLVEFKADSPPAVAALDCIPPRTDAS